MPTAARFTPSLLDEATLEALFVCRHHFIDDCVARVRKTATSSARSAKLFVGPRGAGKTHLLSLVNYRCRHLEEFGKTFQIAWLPEDLWTIDSLESLLKEIVRSIEPALNGPEAGQKESSIATLRRAVSISGPVVVLIENIDQVFEAMGAAGQRELRALIENTGHLLLIATSTRSSESLTNQDSPFYGFFDPTELEQFSVEDAAIMLKRIADQNGNTELSTFLDTPRARQRLAAISHLAGGQPRVWSLLASGLTVEGLDNLVGVLMERFDDLTPYYQEQMARLSLNERKTVRALADLDHSCTVKDLAAATGIDQRSISKTISDLRLKGWVRQRTGPIVEMADGRHSYYDLAEPLARLAFQIKESRGKPIRLIVDFLKLWFDESAFAEDFSMGLRAAEYFVAIKSDLNDASLTELINLLVRRGWVPSNFEPPEIEDRYRLSGLLCGVDDGLASLEGGDASKLLVLPSSLTGLIEDELGQGDSIGTQRLRLFSLAVDFNDSTSWIPRVEGFSILRNGTDRISAHGILSLLYFQNGQTDLAEIELRAFCENADPHSIVVFSTRLVQWGHATAALDATEHPFKEGADGANQVLILAVRLASLAILDRVEQFLDELELLDVLRPASQTHDRTWILARRRATQENWVRVKDSLLGRSAPNQSSIPG
jgi:DNA-binding MarR family transcriptional regulator